MEVVRKITAAVVGILIIIALILLAKWTGDQIRQRFLKPKEAVPETMEVAPKPVQTETPTATYSAIPETGPHDWIYVALLFMLGSGLAALKLAKSRI